MTTEWILRIPAIHEAKSSKNKQLVYISFGISVNTSLFKNLCHPFLINGP